MKGGVSLWSTVVDYFLILSAIIGVGFASGKEICVFFFDFGGMSLLGLLSFGLLYIYLFFVIEHVRKKLNLNSYNEFNQAIFGKMCKLSNVIMLINFSITCAGMLAGADYLFETFFGVGYKIPSIILSVVTFCLLIGGISRIRIVANLIIPVMIFAIVINSIGNINPHNVSLPITIGNAHMAVYYGLLFGVNNFVAALPVLFETKLKSKGKLVVILSICLIILLNILVFASNNFSTDMPMFELSGNVSTSFYYIYFMTLILALFSTLMICSFNMYKILKRQEKSIFLALIIIIFNMILSNFGYGFIVKYLYLISGLFSGVFVVVLIVLMLIKLIRIRKINKKDIDKNFKFKSKIYIKHQKNREKTDKNIKK